jgi:hypothetical protein
MDDILRCKRYIEEALEYADGSHTYEDICAGVASGSLQFWPGNNAMIVTEIVDTPQKRSLNFFLAGGSGNALAELERMTPIILEWGKSKGCDTAVFFGRAGWERTFLTRTGWKKSKLVALEKKLHE